jgi:hypothetical protein
VNIAKLTALSDEALLTLADKIGLIIPPELERPFLIEAILEAYEEDFEDRKACGDASVQAEETKYGGFESDDFVIPDADPSIATRYNETMVRLLVRDTAWAFAFWDIKDEDRAELHAEEHGAGVLGFFLRVMEENGKDPCRGNEHFDIPVEESDLQWYINLPQPDTRYRIDLCCRVGGKIRVLARSNIVHTPRGSLVEGASAIDVKTAELLALSGFDELKKSQAEERHPSRILSGSEAEE